MSKWIDLTGQTFGYLTVLSSAKSDPAHNEASWLCQCSCGKELLIPSSQLRYKNKRACNLDGHRFTNENLRIKAAHELHKSEYRAWAQMLNRCRSPNSPGYRYYGGRGIKVCKRWLKFKNFFEDMGPKPDKSLSIDRIDTNGDYKPENCRWATDKQQSRNRRNKVFVEIKGKVRHLAEVAEEVGIKNSVLNNRIKAQGWDIEKALTTPVVDKPTKVIDNGRCPKCNKLIALVGIRHVCK